MTTDHMTNAWAAASFLEAQSFLDKFESQKTVTVKADSDLVAALIGILEALPIFVETFHRMDQAVGALNEAKSVASRLETELQSQP